MMFVRIVGIKSGIFVNFISKGEVASYMTVKVVQELLTIYGMINGNFYSI